jgi:hypothetical protein
MSEDRTGGPAFPQKEPLTDDHPGMTLRDWFAGQVLPRVIGDLKDGDLIDPEESARVAYRFADAMIEERNQ